MKTLKLKNRIANARDAFFEDRNSNQFDRLVASENRGVAQTDAGEISAPKADDYFASFKKIFAFLPGVLLLHLVVPGLVESGVTNRGLLWLAAGFVLVWAGIGDLKNKKHWLIPASVVCTALVFCLPLRFFLAAHLNYFFYLYTGILPLLFIAPILTRNFIRD